MSPPTDEFTLKVGRRGAELLLRLLRGSIYRMRGEDREYIAGLCYKLLDYLETPPVLHLGTIQAVKVEKSDDGKG
jgi:hypothetical protein